MYGRSMAADLGGVDLALLGPAVLAAFAGAFLGNRLLHKTTLRGVQRMVAVMLFVFALGLIAGVL